MLCTCPFHLMGCLMLTDEAKEKCVAAGFDPSTIMAIISGLITLEPEVVKVIQDLIALFSKKPA
jgi:hypothetical protein